MPTYQPLVHKIQATIYIFTCFRCWSKGVIKQITNFTHQTKRENRTWTIRCRSLAQARSSRPGERSCLAQATGSRLGEPTTLGLKWFHDFSLRRRCLAWASWPVAQKCSISPGRVLEAEPGWTSCYSRLGETSSLRRESQSSPLSTHMQWRKPLRSTPKHTCNGGSSSTQHPKTHATQFHSTTAHIQT